jgi:hypothetical protein
VYAGRHEVVNRDADEGPGLVYADLEQVATTEVGLVLLHSDRHHGREDADAYCDAVRDANEAPGLVFADADLGKCAGAQVGLVLLYPNRHHGREDADTYCDVDRDANGGGSRYSYPYINQDASGNGDG